MGLAAAHDAKALALLGRKLFEVIAPELAEAYEGKVLQDQEAEAARRTSLTMREDNAGTCHGRFRIPALHGQMLRKWSNPSPHPHVIPGNGSPHRSSTGRRSAT